MSQLTDDHVPQGENSDASTVIDAYDIAVTLFSRGLTALIDILTKSLSHKDSQSFFNACLIDDMKPLSFHVQSVSNGISIGFSKLGFKDFKRWDDNEATMADLISRTTETLEHVRRMTVKDMEGVESLPVKMVSREATGREFLLGLAIPHHFFHLQTVYSILRMKGVPLGKSDYLEPFMHSWDRN